jgi:hypothetical protein
MKHLLLITVFVVAMTTKLLAQDNTVIEIKKNDIKSNTTENNQFKIVAHQALDVDLKFDLKKEETYDVIISNSRNKIVLSRENYKEGANKINFTMEEEEQYTVKLISKKPTNLIVCLKEN